MGIFILRRLISTIAVMAMVGILRLPASQAGAGRPSGDYRRVGDGGDD
ncbi:hypothetical protein GGD56_006853 [Rhizobium mongolense]|uniref:Uncharacterized protein n=1 Tax=Rhizobium mongolense TaxID=57676 RepID=A0ABR6IZJ6_9HYPH|nr:hypothetical protein [Rhizobium mongolense]